MVSEELKKKDKILTDIANKYRKGKSQARMTILYRVMSNNLCSRKEKELIWKNIISVSYLKGKELGNKKINPPEDNK